MLVLTRRLEESIVIGDDIEIKIVAIKGSGEHAQVRIGITAPREVAVFRKEVFEAVKAENLRAIREAAFGPGKTNLPRVLPPVAPGGKPE